MSGGGDRFINSDERKGLRTLWTATTLYLVDTEKRSTKALFTTTSDDPITMASEIVLHRYDWEYEAVATKQFIYLLTAEGEVVWKAPHTPAGPAYTQVGIYFLQPPGQFALWAAPTYQASERADWKLPIHVVWLARDQGVVRSTELPEFVPPRTKLPPEERLMIAVAPPALLTILPHVQVGPSPADLPRELVLSSWGSRFWYACRLAGGLGGAPLSPRGAGRLGCLPPAVRRARAAGISQRAGMARARSLPQLQEAPGGGPRAAPALRGRLRPARKDRDGGIRAVAGRMIGVGLLARC